MKRMIALSLSAVCLCLWATPGLSTSADEKIILSNESKTGDVVETETSTSIDVDMKFTATGQPETAIKVGQNERASYQQTVLSDNSVRRVYHQKGSETLNPNGKTQTVSSLQGKTVTIRYGGKKTILIPDHGVLSSEDRVSLQDKDDQMEGMFPDHPVAIGEEWNPAMMGIKKSKDFSDAKLISSEARLVEIVERQGHPCAHFQVGVVLAGKAEGSIDMKMSLDGDGYEALDIHRVLSLDISGPLLIGGIKSDDGSGSGNGIMHMHLKNTWLKVAGKPVKNKLP